MTDLQQVIREIVIKVARKNSRVRKALLTELKRSASREDWDAETKKQKENLSDRMVELDLSLPVHPTPELRGFMNRIFRMANGKVPREYQDNSPGRTERQRFEDSVIFQALDEGRDAYTIADRIFSSIRADDLIRKFLDENDMKTATSQFSVDPPKWVHASGNYYRSGVSAEVKYIPTYSKPLFEQAKKEFLAKAVTVWKSKADHSVMNNWKFSSGGVVRENGFDSQQFWIISNEG